MEIQESVPDPKFEFKESGVGTRPQGLNLGWSGVSGKGSGSGACFEPVHGALEPLLEGDFRLVSQQVPGRTDVSQRMFDVSGPGIGICRFDGGSADVPEIFYQLVEREAGAAGHIYHAARGLLAGVTSWLHRAPVLILNPNLNRMPDLPAWCGNSVQIKIRQVCWFF